MWAMARSPPLRTRNSTQWAKYMESDSMYSSKYMDTDRRYVLRELTSSYLFQDILELDRVKHTKALQDLLTLIALQMGSLVSISELASTLGIDAKTIGRYLDLFEKSSMANSHPPCLRLSCVSYRSQGSCLPPL
jgi:predicted AAA+ superfamily ATPase